MKFRKKPVTIEAIQFTQAMADALEPPAGVIRGEEAKWAGDLSDQALLRNKYGPIFHWYIETLEGRMEVRVGDWVITGVKGEKYSCRADIFQETYEPA